MVKKRKISRIAKLELIGGQAKPGPELASLQIDMGSFTKKFNDATKDRMGDVVPTIITAYGDRSFAFELKTTPAAILIKRAANLKSASSKPRKEIVGSVTEEQLKEIAKYKLVDLNTDDIEKAILILKGQAKNIGISVVGDSSTEIIKEDAPLMKEEIFEEQQKDEESEESTSDLENSEVKKDGDEKNA